MKKNIRSCAQCVEVPEGNLLLRILEVEGSDGKPRFNIYVTLMTIGMQLAMSKKVIHEPSMEEARYKVHGLIADAEAHSKSIITNFAEQFFDKLPVSGDKYYSLVGECVDMDVLPGHMAKIEFIEQCVCGNACELMENSGKLVETSYNFIKLAYGTTEKIAVS